MDLTHGHDMYDSFSSFIYNGGEFIRCPIIPFPHAFSTRWGGVSTLSHLRSFNAASGRGDNEENVAENRRILAQAAGCPDKIIVSGSQIHSATVICVASDDTSPDKIRLFGTKDSASDIDRFCDVQCDESGNMQLCVGELDGFVTASPGLTLLIKVADCAPLLLCDPANNVAGALHAGWRGTSAGIALNGVEAAIKCGADPSTLIAAVGACIHDCCFEVGEDMRDTVISQRGINFADEFIHERGGFLYADIVGMNLRLLLEAGLRRENIALSADCTCCEPERFHSHRSTNGKRGTMGAVISVPQ